MSDDQELEELRHLVPAGQWVNNHTRRVSPNVVGEYGITYEKPCHQLGWCPYGQLVEAYPLHTDADEKAAEHGYYVIADPSDTPHGGPGGSHLWRQVPAGTPDAMPDLNRLAAEGLLDTEFSCDVFGHDCPAFYLAEPFAEGPEQEGE